MNSKLQESYCTYNFDSGADDGSFPPRKARCLQMVEQLWLTLTLALRPGVKVSGYKIYNVMIMRLELSSESAKVLHKLCVV